MPRRTLPEIARAAQDRYDRNPAEATARLETLREQRRLSDDEHHEFLALGEVVDRANNPSNSGTDRPRNISPTAWARMSEEERELAVIDAAPGGSSYGSDSGVPIASALDAGLQRFREEQGRPFTDARAAVDGQTISLDVGDGGIRSFLGQGARMPRVEAVVQTQDNWATPYQDSGLVTRRPQAVNTILDMIPMVTTSRGTYRHMTEVRAAGSDVKEDLPVRERAENTPLALVAPGWEEVLHTQKSIGARAQVTEEALEDNASLGMLIEGRLRRAVRRRMASQIMVGTGQGQQLKGMLAFKHDATSAETVANTFGEVQLDLSDNDTDSKKGKAIVTGLRRAATSLERRDGEYPDSVILSPEGRELIDLLDGESPYVTAFPAQTGPDSLWRMSPAHSHELSGFAAAGGHVAMCGSFRDNSAFLLMRNDIRVELGRSSDDFDNLRITIRAYVRATLVVDRPEAWSLLTVVA